jgi:hypothetical protein
MKKFLIVTNILTLTVIYFNSCGVTTTTSNNSVMHNNSKSIAANYYNTPFNGIDVNLANTMVDNFKNSMGANGQNGARSVWFNLDTLKKFIWHIEQKSKSNGFTALQLRKIGLRVYYGIYPTQNTWSTTYRSMQGVNTTFANLHTVFMIPTYFNGTYNKEFDPTKFVTSIANQAPIPLSYEKILNDPISNPTISAFGAINPDVDLQNHGDLIPPMNNNMYRGADFMQYSDTH